MSATPGRIPTSGVWISVPIHCPTRTFGPTPWCYRAVTGPRRAGLLHGRTVATHWSRTQLLQEEFPGTVVDPDRLCLRDGELWSAA